MTTENPTPKDLKQTRSGLEVQQFTRRTFEVDAVRVTEENIEEVAKWCQGDVRTLKRGKQNLKYVKVRVQLPRDDRQTQAFVGDWVLYAGKGFKVYTDKAFESSFAPATTPGVSVPEQRSA